MTEYTFMENHSGRPGDQHYELRQVVHPLRRGSNMHSTVPAPGYTKLQSVVSGDLIPSYGDAT